MAIRSRQRALLIAFLGVLLCACLSVYKGQDSNWDLLNYHRYVAYAWFHDRLALDLAAAGMQSYFNPSLDLPVYWLGERLPAWLVGATMGAWHGLVFVFTYLIVRDCWPADRREQHVLVAAAGVLAPVFWAGLGNGMGDNAAAVVALAAVWCGIQVHRVHLDRARDRWGWCALTGLLLGACTGLKLTNVTVALALGLALLLSVRPRALSWKVAACLLVTGVLGLLAGGGWWFDKVWHQFGNPFFPQFGTLFASPLADAVSVVDKRFVPESVPGFLLRPVLMLLKPSITSEFAVLPLLWPACYLVACGVGIRWCWDRWGRSRADAGTAWRPEQRMVLVFVLMAAVLWAGLFGIYRYTAAIEPLLPLCMVLLLSRAAAGQGAERWLTRLLWVSMVTAVMGGSVNWGHTGWAGPGFRPDSPMRVEGQRPMVIMVGNGQSWLIPFLPERAHYTSLGGSLDFGQRFDAEVMRRAAESDRTYAVVGMSQNWRFDVVDKANDWLDTLGVLHHAGGCAALERLVIKTRPHAGFQRCGSAACQHRLCMLTKLDADRQEVKRRDDRDMAQATSVLSARGLILDEARCTTEGAFLGQKRYPFRLCELEPQP
jgi:hypothetical protein